jgi:hypothetical protein
MQEVPKVELLMQTDRLQVTHGQCGGGNLIGGWGRGYESVVVVVVVVHVRQPFGGNECVDNREGKFGGLFVVEGHLCTDLSERVHRRCWCRLKRTKIQRVVKVIIQILRVAQE